jgi:hypothetical protein
MKSLSMSRRMALLLKLAIVVLGSTSATGVLAQTDLQKAENLATCLAGKYPNLCKRAWLSNDERGKADQAESRENLQLCLLGRYPNLCRRQRLTPDEAKQVAEAERRENLSTCMTGRYVSLCTMALLSDSERSQVVAAQRAENLRTCSTGRYPVLCNRSWLSADQLTMVQGAEARERSSRTATQSSSRVARRARSATTGCVDGHWIESVSDDGTIVKLEDGSVWEVDAVDAITSMLWLPVTDVIACSDKIINTDDNEKVSARRIR